MSHHTLEVPAIVVVNHLHSLNRALYRVVAPVADDYEIVIVPHAAAALNVVSERPVALLLAHYRLPDMNGLELAQAVKATSPTTYVVLLTIDPAAISAEPAAVAVDQVVAKPFSVNDLQQMLSSMLIT